MPRNCSRLLIGTRTASTVGTLRANGGFADRQLTAGIRMALVVRERPERRSDFAALTGLLAIENKRRAASCSIFAGIESFGTNGVGDEGFCFKVIAASINAHGRRND